MKAHIRVGNIGTLCGSRNRTYSDYSVPSIEFKTLDPSFRCKRCEKKLGLTPGACPKAEADPEFTN